MMYPLLWFRVPAWMCIFVACQREPWAFFLALVGGLVLVFTALADGKWEASQVDA